MLPFAIVGSERNIIVDGKAVRGRKNRWATINVEDEKHCEFVYLRNFLTRSVMWCRVLVLPSLFDAAALSIVYQRSRLITFPTPGLICRI